MRCEEYLQRLERGHGIMERRVLVRVQAVQQAGVVLQAAPRGADGADGEVEVFRPPWQGDVHALDRRKGNGQDVRVELLPGCAVAAQPGGKCVPNVPRCRPCHLCPGLVRRQPLVQELLIEGIEPDGQLFGFLPGPTGRS